MLWARSTVFGTLAQTVQRALPMILVSTAIGSRKYRIPSDLRSQAGYRLVSTMVGDHMGILGVVVFGLCFSVFFARFIKYLHHRP